MRIPLLIFFPTLLLIISCKKEETQCAGSNYAGTIEIVDNYTIVGQTLTYKGRIPRIKFRSTNSNCPSGAGLGATAPYATNFSSGTINGQPLSFKSLDYDMYCNPDTFPVNLSPPYLWEFSPTGHPSFSCTQTDAAMPKFMGYNLIPDSISRSITTTLSLVSINSQSLNIYSDEYFFLYAPSMYGPTPFPANTASINLKAPSDYYDPFYPLYISYYSGTTVSLGGNTYYIGKRATYFKNLKVVP